MSDPRFARLKTDPRFRKLKRKDAKVVVDDRFKSVFDHGNKKSKKSAGRSVDKYGRPVYDDQGQDNLRRFYRLAKEDEEPSAGPDYARGEVLLQSSDEEADDEPEDDESDDGGIVTLGIEPNKPIRVADEDDEAEVNLDENDFANLDAEAIEYSHMHSEGAQEPETSPTRRLAVINLDWDHVRAVHLYKIFSSLVSPTLQNPSDHRKATKNVTRGKVLNVRVYPSQFGKERMEKEEKEGPPVEVFKKQGIISEEEITEKDLIEVGEAEDYNEEALRKYQLDRLRYYYAIVECDNAQTASHVYNELQGTELEYSANVFDLSYVPDDMTFDEEYRDEATEDVNTRYKGLDFVTDALRHSRVKLTWDDDDSERVRMMRRPLSKKEIEEADFKAYIASSDSESGGETSHNAAHQQKAASREKLRALLLGGDDDLPEGWGAQEGRKDDVNIEITFTPGLSESKQGQEDETTLEKYQRKMKEKRKKRKEELKEKAVHEEPAQNDEFFARSSEDERKSERDRSKARAKDPPFRHISTAEELSLLAAADDPASGPRHFDMKAVLKSERSKGKKKRGKRAAREGENETQEDFQIDVQDVRFTAVHEDYNFAIDPTNPHFKKTKNMSTLLEERSKRQKNRPHDVAQTAGDTSSANSGRTLESLAESVKRKSAASDQPPSGKRRKT